MGDGDTNWVAIVVGFLASSTFGVILKMVYDGVVMHRAGVSGREDKRRNDIVAQRDYAIQRMEKAEAEADREEQRADRERDRRIRWQEETARLRLLLIAAGLNPGPLIDETTQPTPGG